MQYIEIWCNTLKCSKLHWSVTNWSVINAMHTHGSMVKCKYYYYYTVKYMPSKFETHQNTVFFGFTIKAHCTCEIQISSVQYGFNFLWNAMGLPACHSDKWRATHSRIILWAHIMASIIPLANCYYQLVNLGRNLILKTTSRETIEDNKHTWMDLYSVHINKHCSNQPIVAKMYKPACKLSLLLCEQYFVILIWSILAEM